MAQIDRDDRVKRPDGKATVLVKVNAENYEKYMKICQNKGIGSYAMYLSTLTDAAIIKFIEKEEKK